MISHRSIVSCRSNDFAASRQRLRPERRGAALLLVMLTLFVASVILTTTVQLTLVSQQQALHTQDRAQAGWLSEAAYQLAHRQRLSGEPGPSIDWTWRPADAGPISKSARIQIEFNQDAGNSTATTVVEYPQDSTFRIRQIRELSLPAATTSPASALDPENRQP